VSGTVDRPGLTKGDRADRRVRTSGGRLCWAVTAQAHRLHAGTTMLMTKDIRYRLIFRTPVIAVTDPANVDKFIDLQGDTTVEHWLSIGDAGDAWPNHHKLPTAADGQSATFERTRADDPP